MRVSVKVILDKRSESKEGYPLKLRIHHSGGYDYISLKMYLDVDNFNKIKAEKRLNEELDLINQEIVQAEARATKIINKMDDFDFQTFKSLFTGKNNTKVKKVFINQLFQLRIEEFKASGKLKSANTYDCTIKAINSLKQKVKFNKVKVILLNPYKNL